MFATHVEDILGRGESNVLTEMRLSSDKCYGESELQESSFVYVGMAMARGKDFSVTLTQREVAKNLQPLPTTPKLWAARR